MDIKVIICIVTGLMDKAREQGELYLVRVKTIYSYNLTIVLHSKIHQSLLPKFVNRGC